MIKKTSEEPKPIPVAVAEPKYVRALEYAGKLFKSEKDLAIYKVKQEFEHYIRVQRSFSGMNMYEFGMLLVCEEPTLSAFIKIIRESGLLYEWAQEDAATGAGGTK